MNYEILSRIDSPEDLKKLSLPELEKLCAEIRDYIIRVVSENGGHLAPNLGVVELTVALHYVLSSPHDKIVWDVSHQAYVHKILTGRRELFQTLRTFGGISGFTNRNESEHDVYTTGHASTSLAYAMGLAEARDRLGGDETVVAVIGDGALTGGVAFEALNNIGHRKTRMLIVLNDNEMSIARNVGALAKYLSRIRLDPAYNRMREEMEKILRNIPLIGERVYTMGEQLKESIKALVVPGMLFEEMGLRYIGPVEGHDLDRLIRALRWSVALKEPVVLDIITKKGKGFAPAEEHPELFHGSSPFEIETGKPKKKAEARSYTSIFSQALVEAARKDEKIVAITAAMPSGTGLDAFGREFPNRFFDVGIAEQLAVTFAAGLAARGLKPVCAIYSTFLERAYDQLIQDVALQELPVIFAIDRGGLVGEDGPTHHGAFDLTYLRSIPNFVVAAPSDEIEMIRVFKAALHWERGPFAFRYPRGESVGLELPDSFEEIEPAFPGSGFLRRSGKHLLILAAGRPVYAALSAADKLEKDGIKAYVYDLRYVKPLPEHDIVELARGVEAVLVVEENTVAGGVSEAVARLLLENGVQVSFGAAALPDEFVPHGKPAQLLHLCGLDGEGLYERARSLLDKKSSIKAFLHSLFR